MSGVLRQETFLLTGCFMPDQAYLYRAGIEPVSHPLGVKQLNNELSY